MEHGGVIQKHSRGLPLGIFGIAKGQDQLSLNGSSLKVTNAMVNRIGPKAVLGVICHAEHDGNS